MEHRSTAALEAQLDDVRRSPLDDGTVELIVRRPAVGERDVVEVGEFDVGVGLVGDTWCERPSSRTSDRSPHPDMQLNIMNARAAACVAIEPDRWPLAGDQLYLDLDVSSANLPAGTRLALGTVVIEVTSQPHRGCAKFSERFGPDAVRFVNSPVGRELNLRGICARVIVGGTVRRGDRVSKV